MAFNDGFYGASQPDYSWEPAAESYNSGQQNEEYYDEWQGTNDYEQAPEYFGGRQFQQNTYNERPSAAYQRPFNRPPFRQNMYNNNEELSERDQRVLQEKKVAVSGVPVDTEEDEFLELIKSWTPKVRIGSINMHKPRNAAQSTKMTWMAFIEFLNVEAQNGFMSHLFKNELRVGFKFTNKSGVAGTLTFGPCYKNVNKANLGRPAREDHNGGYQNESRYDRPSQGFASRGYNQGFGRPAFEGRSRPSFRNPMSQGGRFRMPARNDRNMQGMPTPYQQRLMHKSVEYPTAMPGYMRNRARPY